MKFKALLAAFALVALSAAGAAASTLDVSVNDDSIQGQLFLPLNQDAYGTTQLGVRGLYNDDTESKVISGELSFLGKPGDVPGLTIGAGVGVWAGEATPADLEIFSVGIGARLSYAPPQLMGIGIDGKFFFAPAILTTGDSERLTEGAVRVSYAFIPKAKIFVEYQKINVDFEGGDWDADDDVRAGFEAKF